MKQLVVILFILMTSFNVDAQQRRNMNRIPQTSSEPSEKEIAKRKRMAEDRKDEFIANFISTLEADDFQKEIIKQHLNSFYDEKIGIFKTPYERTFEREQAIKKLEETHFKELENLISKDDMGKIKEMIKGNFDEKEVKKKKKRKEKKKNKG